MSYREENDQVILTLSREDYRELMRGMKIAVIVIADQPQDLEKFRAFLNRLNSGNPHYTPYQTGESKS